MLSFNSHLNWFSSSLFITLISFSSLLISLSSGSSLLIFINSVSVCGYPLQLSFLLDAVSLSFGSVVMFISTVIFIYSYNYMAPYSSSLLFLSLTSLFVGSMQVVIYFSSLFFVILGWDGLGLISFFLIVFYQSQSSVTSGVFTILMNRVGDCFFLVSLGFIFSSSFSFTPFNCHSPNFSLAALLLVTFSTKSALFPFSPWLPMAIAAPTPISALVHSSTLVTAGLYLMLRFSILFVSFPILSDVMVLVCIFTSLYAGLNSLFETDLNKLIALSTLSHLGFIGLSLFLGFIGLSLFHLLTHALFKSLLFIVIGDIMTNLNHSQDIRFLSSGIVYTPASSFIMSLSLLNLLGAPSLCGFFSKDLILESLHYSNASFFVVLVCYTNVIFTYFYTLQFFFFFFQSPNVVPLQLAHKPLLFHSNALFLFALFSLPFPFLFLSMIAPAVIFVSLPLAINLAPLALSLVMLCSLFLFLTQPVYKSPFLYCFFGGMSGLTALFLPLSSSFYHSVAFNLVRSSESGVFNYFTNNLAFRIVLSVSFWASRLTLSSLLSSLLFFTPFLVLLIVLFY